MRFHPNDGQSPGEDRGNSIIERAVPIYSNASIPVIVVRRKSNNANWDVDSGEIIFFQILLRVTSAFLRQISRTFSKTFQNSS